MKKIRNFFKVESNYQLLIVNIVFAITGVTSLYFADYILDIFLVDQNNYNSFFYWGGRILVVLPVYQILLILFGTLFGQSTYFMTMQKKTMQRLRIIFKNK
jgi:hypothetical protein